MSDDTTTTTAADPLDVLTPEQRELVVSAETDECGPGARLGRIVRDLCERLASAERANENMREDLAIIRQIVGHSINLSSPLVCTVSAIVAAKADAEARLAKAVEDRNKWRDDAWSNFWQGVGGANDEGVIDNMCMSDWETSCRDFEALGWLTRINNRMYRVVPEDQRPKDATAALGGTDAGGGEREGRT